MEKTDLQAHQESNGKSPHPPDERIHSNGDSRLQSNHAPKPQPECQPADQEGVDSALLSAENNHTDHSHPSLNKESSKAVDPQKPAHPFVSSTSIDPSPKPPDGGWGWLVVVGCMLGHVLIVGSSRAFGIFYVALIEKFECTATAAATVPSLFNFLRMAFGPVVSWLCDRYTVQKVVIIGGLVFGLASSASAFATDIVYLSITYGVIAALGAGCIFTPMFIILSQYFDKNKGKAMAFSTLGSGVGTVIMAQLVTFLLGLWGYYGAMLITGGLMFNNVVAGALFRPLPKPKKVVRIVTNDKPMQEMAEKNGVSFKSTEGKKVQSKWQSFVSVLKERASLVTNVTFMLHCLTVMSMPFCVNLPLVFIPPLIKEYGYPDHRAKAALLVSAMSLSDMVGRFVFGFVFDLKFIRPHRRPLHTCLGLTMGILVCLIPAMPNMPTLVALCIAWGFIESGFHGQRATIQSSFIAKKQISNSVGFMILFQGIGNITSINFGGMMADGMGTYRYGFVLGGMVMVVFASLFLAEYFIMIIINKRKSRHLKEANAKA